MKPYLIGALLGWGLLAGIAVGQEKLNLPIKVDPPEAVLMIGSQAVPPHPGSGYDIPVGLLSGASSFKLRAPGYRDCSLPPLGVSNIKGYSPGPYVLQPDSFTTYLARNPLVGILGLGGLLAVLGLVMAYKNSQVVDTGAPLLNISTEELVAAASAPGLAPEVEQDLSGQILGDYIVRERIGSGGMATVYLAYPNGQEDDAHRLALKVIKPERATVEYQIRFDREIQVSKQLNHSNVLRLLDWCREGELTYLVMEFVDGAPLTQFIKEGGMDVRQAMKFIPGIIQGLAYAHSLGIVHRDIKPENVMVTRDGQVKLMDFGLARNQDVKTVTSFGFAVGTPEYMAPEQILRGPDRSGLTDRTDQYALGILFFVLLAGKHPFEWDDPMKLVMMHIKSEPPAIRTIRPDVPEGVEVVLQRMMSKEPEARFHSVKQAGQAFYEAVRDIVPGCGAYLQTLEAIASPPPIY